MKPRLKIIGILFLISLQLSVFGQEVDYTNDSLLDYFPRITSIKFDATSLLSTSMQGEFIEIIKILSKKILGEDCSVNRISGYSMLSGICPPQIAEAEKWMKIDIDREGSVNKVEIYEDTVKINKSLSEQFMDILKTAKINPAIRGGEAVNVRLYYTVERK